MPRPSPLPNSFEWRGFTVKEAATEGLSRARLRPSDLVSPFHGTRIPARVQLDLLARSELAMRILPEGAFMIGATAALLWRMPLPHAVAAQVETALDVAVTPPRAAPRRNGIRGRQISIDRAELVSIGTVRLTSAARTWCDLSPMLELPDLVAVGDHLIRRRSPTCTRAVLAGAVDAFGRRRGRALLERALPLLSDRSESPPESVLRVVLTTAGLPSLLANVDIVDENGRFVARVDLLFAEYPIVLEYEGDHHRDKAQWRRDMTRIAEIESLGYTVIRVNADDLVDVAGLIRRIERQLLTRGWRR
ncbi:endonuclease domain-containing protein [Leifsonia sp. Leaf264]|uniref:endonuclease domain-containing protein n=1 Tax=Leifsonia sp. Leaf264 TaxID=1736314 RepID=UPI0006FB92FA|nr:DUF559 domain-containing protein [Leifsonia sp. Leaf264]KQO96801.1 hypothetical protein ASF30_17085 [Leifsonia sp. Leaf264]